MTTDINLDSATPINLKPIRFLVKLDTYSDVHILLMTNLHRFFSRSNSSVATISYATTLKIYVCASSFLRFKILFLSTKFFLNKIRPKIKD